MRGIGMIMGLAAGVCLAATTFGDTVIEGFENSANPGGWQSVSPDPQTWNVTAQGTLTYGTAHVTEGAASGTFAVTWAKPGTATTLDNPYVAGGTKTYWAIRYNIATPTAFPSIPKDATVRIDVYNNTPDTIQFAPTVLDSSGLERGPFKPIAPNASTVYEWNTTTEAPTSFVTGNGVLEGTSYRLRGIHFYTETEPTQAAFSADLDNIRAITPQTDLTPPAPPVVLSVEQSAAVGQLLVKWKANTEPDLAGYNVYLATDADFGAVIGNRFTWPTQTSATIAAPATQVTVTGVPTDRPVYIKVTALDNATPNQNESMFNPALAAHLNSDGSVTSDVVVLDLSRYAPGVQDFTVQGYEHMVVYYAQALAANGRTFCSASGVAVNDGLFSLSPDPGRIVYYCNGLDGNQTGTASESLSAGSVTAVNAYVLAGGKLMICGANVGEDLEGATRPDAAAANAFYANTLRTDLTNPYAGADVIDGGGPFASAGTFQTGTDVFDYAALATLSNEVLMPLSGASSAMTYTPAASGNASVYFGNHVIVFGFEFASVRDEPAATFAAGAAKRATLLGSVITYLSFIPSTAASDWVFYE